MQWIVSYKKIFRWGRGGKKKKRYLIQSLLTWKLTDIIGNVFILYHSVSWNNLAHTFIGKYMYVGKYIHFRFDHKLHKRTLNYIIYLFQLTLTYDFCFFICQGFIEKNFLYTQGVSWGKDNSCRWHWRFTIFLLQTVRYDKEDSEAYVHSLQRKKFQNKNVRKFLFFNAKNISSNNSEGWEEEG